MELEIKLISTKNSKKTKTKVKPKPQKRDAAEAGALAQRLLTLADKNIMSVKQLTNHPEILKKARIKNVSDEVFARAELLEHKWDDKLRNMVWDMGGTWNGQRRKEPTPVKQEEKATPTIKVEEKQPKPPVEKDKWGYRTTSSCAKINAVLSDKWMSITKIQKISGASTGLVYSHARSLESKGLVIFNRAMKVVKLSASQQTQNIERSTSQDLTQSGSKTARKTKKARKK